MATSMKKETASSEGREVDVVDAEGKTSGTAVLPAEVFDVQTNVPLIHQVVVARCSFDLMAASLSHGRAQPVAAADA